MQNKGEVIRLSDRNMERLDNIDKNKYIYLLGDRVREFREDENYTHGKKGEIRYT